MKSSIITPVLKALFESSLVRELILCVIALLAFCYFAHGQSQPRDTILLDSVISSVDTTVDTSYSTLMDAESISKFAIQSPVNTLDLSDLKPRQKMRLVRQLQRLTAKNQRLYIRVITRTIRAESKYDYKRDIALAKIQARLVEDSIKYNAKIRSAEIDAHIRTTRITAKFETKQKRIESSVGKLVGWLSFSVLMNVLLMWGTVKRMLGK